MLVKAINVFSAVHANMIHWKRRKVIPVNGRIWLVSKRILPYAAVFFKIVAVPAVLNQLHGSSCS